MKLSEAIRAGAALRPQAHGEYVINYWNGPSRTCAIGAAYEGITGKLPDPDWADDLNRVRKTIYKATGADDVLLNTVIQLNDDQYQTREQIADWLEAQGL